MFSGIRCVVFSVLMGITPAALAWQPTGSLEELYDASLLPRLRPGVVARSFSSYDRTGGNNDGFSGQYSKLREEDGNSVIAEMEGPGCIQRIWFTHSVHKEDGLLERKHEHIKIYLDGKDTPALDVPLENLFDGSLEHFPHPLAGQGIGGFYSYVPIPYLKSCKVVIDGLGVRFYQLNYVTFPSAEGVRPFSMELTDAESAALTEAVKRWSDPLAYTQAHKQLTMQLKVEYEPGGRRNMKYSAHPEGEYSRPLLINGITLSNLTPDEVRQGVLVIDFDKPEGYALRVPMELYFGQAFQPESFAGLFFGRQSDVYYNIVPFVVPNDCTFSVEGPAAFKPLLTIFMSIIDETTRNDCGRLQVQVNASLPTKPDILHPILDATGQGHYLGTYLITEGPNGLPYWLEGDDKWTIDGELRIHGTGSEDYFNCGWYALEGRLNGPAALPSHGFPIYGIAGDKMRAAAYRWHLADPVPFDREISVGIEHGEKNQHVADYRSLAFYYAK